ncbi:MAG TPA: T9SS type A sorting domain-containing protein, partial [Candidatus Kapabacteria bacterium]|nr:T9SS type A sorting domain-containing protein [Candidatus Kapabacteria bacterium]
ETEISTVYPNPLGTENNARITLAAKDNISLTLTNIMGKTVRAVAHGAYSAGTYDVPFSASGLPSGVYYLLLQTDKGLRQSRQLMIVR